jgi:hypothetical protein
VDRGWDRIEEGGQIGDAADLVEPLFSREFVGEGEEVRRLPPVVEVENRLIDQPVRAVVEVVRFDDRGNLDDRIAIDQQTAEDRLLGL